MKVEINGVEYGFQWGLGAIEIYCDAMFTDIEGLDLAFTVNREQPKAITNLYLAAIQNHLELTESDKKVPTYREMQAFLSDLDQETYVQIQADFLKSKYFGKTIAEYFQITDTSEEEGLKKKATRKKSVSQK